MTQTYRQLNARAAAVGYALERIPGQSRRRRGEYLLLDHGLVSPAAKYVSRPRPGTGGGSTLYHFDLAAIEKWLDWVEQLRGWYAEWAEEDTTPNPDPEESHV